MIDGYNFNYPVKLNLNISVRCDEPLEPEEIQDYVNKLSDDIVEYIGNMDEDTHSFGFARSIDKYIDPLLSFDQNVEKSTDKNLLHEDSKNIAINKSIKIL